MIDQRFHSESRKMKLYSQVMHVNVVSRPMHSINMRDKADFLLFVSVRSAGDINTRADLLGCFFRRLGFTSHIPFRRSCKVSAQRGQLNPSTLY